MGLANLKLLKNDMLDKGWVISSFLFKYKSIEYIVLVHLFGGRYKKKDPYALVLLEFLEKNNLDHELRVEANSGGLILHASKLRDYFGIKYGPNLGDVLSQFTNTLNRFIPTIVNENFSKEQKQAMTASLSSSDSEDPNKIYCSGVKRNPIGCSRSNFNDNKARLLRPKLYKNFKDDKTISFCFSFQVEKEKTDSEILEAFSKNGS